MWFQAKDIEKILTDQYAKVYRDKTMADMTIQENRGVIKRTMKVRLVRNKKLGK